ncbi:MAG: hypothetical protein H9W81_08330 [Enterococcus sp.]|nr:hypothetical protein [Enterococcus sp.]
MTGNVSSTESAVPDAASGAGESFSGSAVVVSGAGAETGGVTATEAEVELSLTGGSVEVQPETSSAIATALAEKNLFMGFPSFQRLVLSKVISRSRVNQLRFLIFSGRLAKVEKADVISVSSEPKAI